MAAPNPEAGWFDTTDVAILAGVRPTRVGQWARSGLVHRANGHYQWGDVAEALAVHHLFAENVSTKYVHDAVKTCRHRYGLGWALRDDLRLSVQDSVTEGRHRRVVVVDGPDGPSEIAGPHGHTGQGVLEQVDLRPVPGWLRRGGWAVRNHPNLDRITVDPDRLGGRPTIRDHRMPVADVVGIAEARNGRQLLREEYDLTDQDIDQALEWARLVEEATGVLLAA